MAQVRLTAAEEKGVKAERAAVFEVLEGIAGPALDGLIERSPTFLGRVNALCLKLHQERTAGRPVPENTWLVWLARICQAEA